MIQSCTDATSPEAVQALLGLLFPDQQSTLDPTYGNGNFWNGHQPTWAGDILPGRAKQCVLDYHALPFRDKSVDVVIFDPPFQPASTRTTAGKTERQFRHITGGVPAVKASVQAGLVECARVARLGVIVKVQDYIHSHKPVWMSKWVWDALGEPYDFMVLRQQSPKMRAANWGEQKSVWRNHSTFWVYRWKGLR